jgi:AcrR family transcriptional regulator
MKLDCIFNSDAGYSTKIERMSMKVSESDPRAIRTRTRLREALMAIVAEKDFASLTIQEVTGRAGLNRTTFYLHYTGLHELLEDCARDLFGQMRAEIYRQAVGEYKLDIMRLQPFVAIVFHHLERHAKFYRVMLGKHGDPLFRVLFQDLLLELIFEPLREEAGHAAPDVRLEIALRFFSAGFMGVAAWWLENGMPLPAAEAARLITRDILPDYLRLMA